MERMGLGGVVGIFRYYVVWDVMGVDFRSAPFGFAHELENEMAPTFMAAF
jgi:hypothetical protein